MWGRCTSWTPLNGFTGPTRGYDGYYTLDIWPARMDTVEAIRESIEWIQALRRALDHIGGTTIENMMREGNPAKTMKIIREAVFR